MRINREYFYLFDKLNVDEFNAKPSCWKCWKKKISCILLIEKAKLSTFKKISLMTLNSTQNLIYNRTPGACRVTIQPKINASKHTDSTAFEYINYKKKFFFTFPVSLCFTLFIGYRKQQFDFPIKCTPKARKGFFLFLFVLLPTITIDRTRVDDRETKGGGKMQKWLSIFSRTMHTTLFFSQPSRDYKLF